MFPSLPVFHHEPAGRAEVERRLVNITVGREVSYNLQREVLVKKKIKQQKRLITGLRLCIVDFHLAL